MANNQLKRLTLPLLFGVFLVGCQEDSPSSGATNEAIKEADRSVELQSTLPLPKWDVGALAASRDAARRLERVTNAFLDSVDEPSRSNWQAAWREAHDNYHRTNLLLHDRSQFSRIDPWPVMPGFVDSLPEYPVSGIINDETLNIDAETIRQQHQVTDDSEIALGFHVIEYYAFERPIEDFQPGISASDRRRQFITLITEQLITDEIARSNALEQWLETLGYDEATRSLTLAVKQLNSELGDWENHGEFSGTAHHNLRLQVTTLQTIIGNETGFGHYLIELDSNAAMTTNKTLQRIIEMVGESADEMADPEEISLILSGLALQLQSINSAGQPSS